MGLSLGMLWRLITAQQLTWRWIWVLSIGSSYFCPTLPFKEHTPCIHINLEKKYNLLYKQYSHFLMKSGKLLIEVVLFG